MIQFKVRREQITLTLQSDRTYVDYKTMNQCLNPDVSTTTDKIKIIYNRRLNMQTNNSHKPQYNKTNSVTPNCSAGV